MHVRQNFHFARIFFPRKNVEVVYTLSLLITEKKKQKNSFLWHLSPHQNQKNFEWLELKYFPNIFQWLFETPSCNKL